MFTHRVMLESYTADFACATYCHISIDFAATPSIYLGSEFIARLSRTTPCLISPVRPSDLVNIAQILVQNLESIEIAYLSKTTSRSSKHERQA